jgi:hypothetical protein
MIPHTLTNMTAEEFNEAMESVGCPVRADEFENDPYASLIQAFVWLAQRQAGAAT